MVPVPVFATTTPYADVAVQLRDLELVPEHETENSLTVAEGRILSVSPEPGTRVYPGDTVTVTTSLGPAEVSIVRLRGMTREQVAQYAEDAVLTLGDDAPQNYDSRDAGTVIGARVSKEAGGEGYGCLDGCNAYQGYTLTLTTSAGPVPEVAGVSADEARSRLSDAGLEVAEENTLEYSDTVAEGVTIRYDVADPEAALHPGDTVTIVESQGPQPVPVPEIPEGTTLPDAIAILEDAGLTASYDTGKWSAFLNAGLGGFVVVQSTSPAAGESVLPGSTVTLNAKLANLID
jgi:serine/threonine-protein kinase